jgi:hypothetical protein
LETWEETLARWKRSLPSWKVAITVVVLPFVVWWAWPVSYSNVGQTYRLMYTQLRHLRERPQDKTGMDEFVQRSQATLDELIPWLKKRATSEDPDTQLLLWIGRDCLRPMLKSPRTRESKHEILFKKLLAQWEEAHHVVPPDETRPEDSDEPAWTPPANSSPVGFGRDPEPDETPEMKLPPPSTKGRPDRDDDDVKPH